MCPIPVERISVMRGCTAKALSGQETGEAPFDCLGVVARECRLPPQVVEDVLAGFALDAADWRPSDRSRPAPILLPRRGCGRRADGRGDGGRSRRPRRRSTAPATWGLAFQLANIARDVEEDDRAGRCYLPAEWLAEADIEPGQHMKPWQRDALVPLVTRLCDQAERYEASARVGAARLPVRSRWAVLAAAGIYGDIARGVRRRGAHAWDHREMTSRASKLGWIGRAAVQARRAPVPVGREGLWTRPG